MKVGLGQLRVSRDWRQNLQTVRDLVKQSADEGARLLVLPEGLIARDPADPQFTGENAQPLDGPFVTGLREISADSGVAIAGTVHVPAETGLSSNVHVVVDHGRLLAAYRKLHLYDAFATRESDQVLAGDEIPALVEIDGLRFGLLTCYDVRFPELARSHAIAGADALLLPAAWVRGSLKEDHWQTLVTARALENTVYVVAVGEISEQNIGRSMLVDPLGVTIAALADQPGLAFGTLDPDRISEVRRRLPVLANRRFADPVLNLPSH